MIEPTLLGNAKLRPLFRSQRYRPARGIDCRAGSASAISISDCFATELAHDDCDAMPSGHPIVTGSTIDIPDTSHAERLAALGWSAFYAEQLQPDETALIPTRISSVHRARLSALSLDGPVTLELAHKTNTGDFAVGDWVLADPVSNLLVRRLDRRTLLQRRPEGKGAPQLAAANVDTLFIVTSCNDDFNPARLERYLALANQAGTNPVIVLTKADTVEDAEDYRRQALVLQRDLAVSPSMPATPAALQHCCHGAAQARRWRWSARPASASRRWSIRWPVPTGKPPS